MNTPTQAEIESEITALRNLAPRIRQFDSFGGDNRVKIEAQIETLEDDLSEDDIYDKEDSDEWDNDTASSAMEARQWADGEEEAPSKGWAHLAK